MSKAGYAKKGGIPEWMTFRQWCEDLAAKGMRIDQKPFSLADRPALIPLYDAIPTTRAEAFGQMIVVQKATQLGLTVWEVLADLYMAKKWGPVNIGMFLPETTTASFKSQHRFMPIVRIGAGAIPRADASRGRRRGDQDRRRQCPDARIRQQPYHVPVDERPGFDRVAARWISSAWTRCKVCPWITSTR